MLRHKPVVRVRVLRGWTTGVSYEGAQTYEVGREYWLSKSLAEHAIRHKQAERIDEQNEKTEVEG